MFKLISIGFNKKFKFRVFKFLLQESKKIIYNFFFKTRSGGSFEPPRLVLEPPLALKDSWMPKLAMIYHIILIENIHTLRFVFSIHFLCQVSFIYSIYGRDFLCDFSSRLKLYLKNFGNQLRLNAFLYLEIREPCCFLVEACLDWLSGFFVVIG